MCLYTPNFVPRTALSAMYTAPVHAANPSWLSSLLGPSRPTRRPMPHAPPPPTTHRPHHQFSRNGVLRISPSPQPTPNTDRKKRAVILPVGSVCSSTAHLICPRARALLAGGGRNRTPFSDHPRHQTRERAGIPNDPANPEFHVPLPCCSPPASKAPREPRKNKGKETRKQKERNKMKRKAVVCTFV